MLRLRIERATMHNGLNKTTTHTTGEKEADKENIAKLFDQKNLEIKMTTANEDNDDFDTNGCQQS